MFCKANKRIIKFVNNILVITKRVIFTMYYRGDGSTKSADILDEFRKNIRLTIKYMSENAIFFNISLDVCMKVMLCKSFKLIGNLIRNRPSLHFYIMKYKGVLSSNNRSYDIEKKSITGNILNPLHPIKKIIHYKLGDLC